MDQAKQERTRAKGQFTRSKKSLSEAVNHPDPSLATIERRFDDLKKRWNHVQDTHDAYAEYISDMQPEEADKLDEWIDAITNEFNDLEMVSDKKSDLLKGSHTAPTHKIVNSSTSNPTSNVGAVKVERMKFAQFDGDIRRYPQFKQEFRKHVATLYREDQRAFVLKGYLTMPVLEEVESCGEDYTAMWERLDQRFGDTGKLINAIMDEVTSLPRGRDDDVYTLQMIRTVEKAYRDLTRLETEGEMYNATTIVAIEKRMPEAMRQEWAKEVAGKVLGSKKKFLMLIECLQLWRNRLEYLSDGVRAIPRAGGTTSHVQIRDAAASPSFKRESCWIHGTGMEEEEMHPIWRCKEFIGQPLEEKIRLVEHYKACKVCLLISCPGQASPEECRRNFRCRIQGCGGIHNRLLHSFEKSVTGSSAHADTETAAQGSTLLQIQQL